MWWPCSSWSGQAVGRAVESAAHVVDLLVVRVTSRGTLGAREAARGPSMTSDPWKVNDQLRVLVHADVCAGSGTAADPGQVQEVTDARFSAVATASAISAQRPEPSAPSLAAARAVGQQM